MINESVEDYLGAIYRLRGDCQTHLPLSCLQEYFDFSRVSIHEMIQRLEEQGFVTYHHYHGVLLTDSGETIAIALLRRHRLWERFLTDMLQVPWDEAHEVACQLEHAAPEAVTERLASLLGNPEACPHGAAIPPHFRESRGEMLTTLDATETEHVILRIWPEKSEVLRFLEQVHLGPGSHLRVVQQTHQQTLTEVEGSVLSLPTHVAETIWVTSI